MNIATILNSHGNTELTLDTIQSIQHNVGENILLVIDGLASEWANQLMVPSNVHKYIGIPFGKARAPYRNVALGFQQAIKLFPQAKWYCYCESDVVFASNSFQEELLNFEKNGVWCAGNDFRKEDFRIPFLEFVFGQSLPFSAYLLGCCVFYYGDFLRKITNIIDAFLNYTALNHDLPGYLSKSRQIEGYDISEHLYPTLAVFLGGKIGCFSLAKSKGIGCIVDEWDDRFCQYALRFKPEIKPEEVTDNLVIAHPVKEYNHVLREKLREKRSHVF